MAESSYQSKTIPKVRELQKRNETISSFEAWKGNLIYSFMLDKNFSEFLEDGFEWLPKSSKQPNRGLADVIKSDGTVIIPAAQRVKYLEICLGRVAGYAPVISRATIVQKCRSFKEIFQKLRAHYGFALTGSSILDVVAIQKQGDESYEDLFQRIQAQVDSSLLSTETELEHHGQEVEEDEQMTPTLENLVVSLWLKAIHPSLPQLVKIRYSTQLKSVTIASIREEISSCIPELLTELNERDIPTNPNPVFQTGTPGNNRYGSFPRRPNFHDNRNTRGSNRGRYNSGSSKRPPPSCALCKQAGRPQFDHYLSTCRYLPYDDRPFIGRARLIELLELDNEESYPPYSNLQTDLGNNLPQDDSYGYDNNHQYQTGDSYNDNNQGKVSRVTTEPSPWFNAYYKSLIITITLDTGATINLISERFAQHLKLTITPASQSATQCDQSNLTIVGETRFSMRRGFQTLQFEGLVARGISSDILSGMPFMKMNSIAVDPEFNQIRIGNEYLTYDSFNRNNPPHIRRVESTNLITNSSITLYPNDYVDVPYCKDKIDSSVILHPNPDIDWLQPDVVNSIDGKVRLTNSSNLPVNLSENQSIASITSLQEPIETTTNGPIKSSLNVSIKESSPQVKFNPQGMNIDPIWESKFRDLHSKFHQVFQNDLPGYNGKFGPISAYVNVGDSLPPQRRGKVPQYSRHLLSELQDQFDNLEQMGVFATPESVGSYAEYVNPSFLLKKPDNSYRLVTSFGEVASHNKPTPTLTPNTDKILNHFGTWKYIIKTDMRKAYFQIPLHPDSRRFCAVVTPYKGVRVYLRAAMGMPGSECALDELMSRILGDLIQEGSVERIADDLYIGADDIVTLFKIWEKVLMRFQQADLRFSLSKTVILPLSTTVLGWIWTNGQLSASLHHTSSLAICEIPKTVKGLRSFLGAYKVVSRVLKHCSQYLAPLESLSAGKQSADKVCWDEITKTAFHNAQSHLKNCAPITIPSPDHHLWIITDACSSKSGIASTLVATEQNKSNPKLSSFYSAKLKQGHDRWLPCEIECLAIASSINHFRPFILESNHRTNVLTDSKPVVQAYEKFMRGQFSSSSRMQSFLLAATQNNVKVSHIKGSNNALSDFGSRNSVECHEPNCSVCKFIGESENVSVNQINVSEIIKGSVRVPFSSPNAWLQIQLNCATIQLVRKHLQQGTRPLKNQRNLRDVRSLLRVSSVTNDGLVVVNKQCPLQPDIQLIVIPQSYVQGLLTMLHLQLDHPTTNQLRLVYNRQFYSTNSEVAIKEIRDKCHLCLSLCLLPKPLIPNSTSAPYDHVGSNFSTDVIRRTNQKILVLTEEVTKFTATKIIESEQSSVLLKNIKSLLLPLHPPCSPTATLKVDPAPGMQTLYKEQPLQQINVKIELGEAKNKNKLATIDKIIQELENEFIRFCKPNTPISLEELSLATASLNSRIRISGLSAYEQWHKRNQFNKKDIDFRDESLIKFQSDQRDHRNDNNIAISKTDFQIGSIVLIISEKDKHHPRPRYIVDRIEGCWLYVRKLTDSQLRAKLYRVHRNACTKFQQTSTNVTNDETLSDSDDHETLENVSYTPEPSNDNIETQTETNHQPAETSSTQTGRPPRDAGRPAWLKDYVLY